jgi:hypothetical protein
MSTSCPRHQRKGKNGNIAQGMDRDGNHQVSFHLSKRVVTALSESVVMVAALSEKG